MARKKRKKSKKQREYKYNTPIQRMLLPPLLNPYKKKKSDKGVREQKKHKKVIKELKKAKIIRWADVKTYPQRRLRAKLMGKIRYFDPRNTLICQKRKIRREELFKKGLVGKGIAVSKTRIRDLTSRVYCKRR